MLPIPSRIPLPIRIPIESPWALSSSASIPELTASKTFLIAGEIVIFANAAPTFSKLTKDSLIKVLRVLFNSAFL